MNQQFVRITRRGVMLRMRPIDQLTQASISDHDPNMEEKPVKAVLEQRPDQNAGGKQPREVAIRPAAVTEREHDEKDCQ
jgi:hypothetical protein